MKRTKSEMKSKPLAETFDFKRKFIERTKGISGRKCTEVHLIQKADRKKQQSFRIKPLVKGYI
jgi:hypothetical protein